MQRASAPVAIADIRSLMFDLPSRQPPQRISTVSSHEHLSLAAIARHLIAAPPGSIHSVHAAGATGGWTTRLRTLVDGPEDLVGQRADADWAGIGLVFEGTIGAGGDRVVRFAHVLHRDGSSEVTILDDATATPIQALGQPSGFLADIARRMLDLPCEPELASPADLLLSDWLTAVLDRRADPVSAHAVAGWADAATLHPVVGGGDIPSPTELAHLTVDAARRWPWRRILASARRGTVVIDGLTPDTLAWMDEPFFARWMLGVHRGVTELLDDLRLFTDEALFDELQRTVETVEWLGFVPAEKGDG